MKQSLLSFYHRLLLATALAPVTLVGGVMQAVASDPAGTPHGDARPDTLDVAAESQRHPQVDDLLSLPRSPWSGSVAWPDRGRVGSAHTPAPSDGMARLARRLLVDNLPETYEDDRKWGKTARRWDGLHLRADGLRIRTKRRWKDVNHGVWQKYRIAVDNPDQNLQLDVRDLRELKPGTVALRIHLVAPVTAHARRARWHYGVQLFSVSVDAQATADVVIDLQVRLRLRTEELLPGVELVPRVHAATFRLRDYRVERVSKLDGRLAYELGDATESLIKRKLAEKEKKLVAKMNRQIERHSDDLTFSVTDWLRTEWNEWIPAG